MIRKIIYSTGILSSIIFLLSFTKKINPAFSAKGIEQNMAKIQDDLFVCKYEVSNSEYQFFLNELKVDDAKKAEQFKVDSLKWLNSTQYQQPMSAYYHLHPAFKNYPVVCISYEAATAYCNWLTEYYNNDAKRKFKKVKFYLPSEEEWMKVANNGDRNKIYPWSDFYLRNKNGEFLCNFKHVSDAFISYDNEREEYKIIPEARASNSYTSPVKSFQAIEPYGIYNMSGNVAEMVSEKGIAKGGSYNSTGYDVRISSQMKYSESSPEVGFRVFMKVLEP